MRVPVIIQVFDKLSHLIIIVIIITFVPKPNNLRDNSNILQSELKSSIVDFEVYQCITVAQCEHYWVLKYRGTWSESSPGTRVLLDEEGSFLLGSIDMLVLSLRCGR